MQLPLLDLSIFLIYMLGIILFGASFYFKNRSAEEFISGGGNLPSWAIGMSIFATFVSSISFLALPGNAYLSNWNGYVFSLSIPLADRKSTRLNSSHVRISYAVFCLKKKKKIHTTIL